MTMEEQKKAYYDTITGIWKLFRSDIATVQTITDAQDRRWEEIVNRYTELEKTIPENIRYYGESMILLTVNELENMWRLRK